MSENVTVSLLDLVLGEPLSWQRDALCQEGYDPAWFFPARGENAKCEAARSVCRRCLVRRECLEYALAMPPKSDEVGMFGGLSARERRRARTVGATAQQILDAEASYSDADEVAGMTVDELVARGRERRQARCSAELQMASDAAERIS